MLSHLVPLSAAFIGSAVESVEALTIVLAVGITRGWRAPLYGALSALVLLVILVLSLGQLITTYVPEAVLKLVVGTLILLFGMRWLRKAVQRSAGLIPMHDEELEYRETVAALAAAGIQPRMDWAGFAVAFKGVFLEGVEVAFIVFAVGSNSHDLSYAALGGIAAMVLVAAIGVLVRRPLSQVPENSLKFAVGILLSTLGTFWAAEGMGLHWPGDIASAGVLLLIYALGSALAVTAARRARPVTA